MKPWSLLCLWVASDDLARGQAGMAVFLKILSLWLTFTTLRTIKTTWDWSVGEFFRSVVLDASGNLYWKFLRRERG